MNGDAGYDRWQIGQEWKSRICPRRLITEESSAWLRIYSTYKAGHLAVAGGVFDQPALYIHAMTRIQQYIAEATSTEDDGKS